MAQTLAQLYAEVDAHQDTLSRVVGEDRAYMVKVTITYKTGPTASQSLSKWIMVKDRDKPAEAAYWEGSKPAYLTAADSFPDLLAAQLAAYKAAHPEFEIYEVIDTRNTEKWATVRAYVYDAGSGKSTLKNYLFFRAALIWYVREIV